MDGATYPNEPLNRWSDADLDGLLAWAFLTHAASDITLVPERCAYIKVHGINREASLRPVPAGDIVRYMEYVYRSSSASALVRGGEPLDYDHPVRLDRSRTLRFRVNGMTVRDREDANVSVVLRPIPSEPPRLDGLHLPDALVKLAFPERGLVLVTGRTGSGKTTLIAALLRRIIEEQYRSVQTLESPIEFDLTGLKATGPITQTSVPGMVKSFALGIRATTRRSTDVLLVGEARDAETFAAMLWSAETGTCVYATLHTPSAAEVFPRVVNAFPHIQQPAVAASLLESVRLIVHQRLAPRIGGGRVALHEWASIDPALRERLYRSHYADFARLIGEHVRSAGTDLVASAEAAFRAGLIARTQLDAVIAERRVVPSDGGGPLLD